MNSPTIRLGYYSSLVSFLAAAGYSIAQILQIVGVITFPIDAILIYGFSFCIAWPYLISVIAVHYSLPVEKRIWSQIALAFAILYAGYVNLNYVVQLATVIPASSQNSLNEIRVLDQTPHSMFWDVDALGYICMGISTFFLAFAFAAENSYRWLKRFLVANGLMVPVISIVYFYPHFSILLLILGSPWIVTTSGSLLLLTIYFKNKNTTLPK